MKYIISTFFLLTVLSLFTSAQNSNFNRGTLFCNIDGDTLTWSLMTTQTSSYFEALTSFGPPDKGLIKLLWDNISSPADIKTGTTLLKGYSGESSNITVMWADIANVPYVIKNGTINVTENSGGIIKGTLEMTVELGGSSVIGEILKGKKESILKEGYFEIKY